MNVDIKNQLISRTAKVIMYVGDNPEANIKQISRELNIDYNFVSKIIQRCEELWMLVAETVSREKRITLIQKGLDISKALKAINLIL